MILWKVYSDGESCQKLLKAIVFALLINEKRENPGQIMRLLSYIFSDANVRYTTMVHKIFKLQMCGVAKKLEKDINSQKDIFFVKNG